MENASERLVQVAAWKALPWLRHGFSTRLGGVSTVYRGARSTAALSGELVGDLNLGWTKDDDPAHVAENRRRLMETVDGAAIGAGRIPQLITVRQVHSSVSLKVPESAGEVISHYVGADGRALVEADGLVTGRSGVLLGIQTADCVPVLVADTRLRAVGCFHAGWRGTAARIVEAGVGQMVREFGCRTEDLTAAVGPAIGACCYSVGEEVYRTFCEEFSYGAELFRQNEGEVEHLDLWEANRRQLMDAGVADGRISVVGECTGCAGLPGRRRYFSHRCEHGFTGRMLSVIGMVGAA